MGSVAEAVFRAKSQQTAERGPEFPATIFLALQAILALTNCLALKTFVALKTLFALKTFVSAKTFLGLKTFLALKVFLALKSFFSAEQFANCKSLCGTSVHQWPFTEHSFLIWLIYNGFLRKKIRKFSEKIGNSNFPKRRF